MHLKVLLASLLVSAKLQKHVSGTKGNNYWSVGWNRSWLWFCVSSTRTTEPELCSLSFLCFVYLEAACPLPPPRAGLGAISSHRSSIEVTCPTNMTIVAAQMHTTLQCILLSSLQTNIVMLRSFSEMLEMLPSIQEFSDKPLPGDFFFWLHSLCKDAISHSHICQWQIACAYFRQHSSLLEWDTYIQSPHPPTHTHTNNFVLTVFIFFFLFLFFLYSFIPTFF